MTESETTRQLRLSSTTRGILIAVLIGFYSYVMDHPGASFTASLLVAAGLQVGVLLLRRFVTPDLLPQAMYLLEMLADAATVFLFALGVYGGMLRYGLEV
jgi:hypothetical protein